MLDIKIKSIQKAQIPKFIAEAATPIFDLFNLLYNCPLNWT